LQFIQLLIHPWNQQCRAEKYYQVKETEAIAVIAIQQPHLLTFEEFLNYDDGTDTLYELIDGVTVVMPEPSRLHQGIARYLDQMLGSAIEAKGENWEPVRNTVIKVPGKYLADGRRPDIAVVDQLPPEIALQEKGIRTVPHLIVEIASSNWANDVRDKILGYLHLGVPEYWVVDYAGLIPEKYCDRGKGIKTIVHTLQPKGYGYDRVEYLPDKSIPCLTFGEHLQLTTNLIVGLGQETISGH
jgi:Uma2 family endonuclease